MSHCQEEKKAGDICVWNFLSLPRSWSIARTSQGFPRGPAEFLLSQECLPRICPTSFWSVWACFAKWKPFATPAYGFLSDSASSVSIYRKEEGWVLKKSGPCILHSHARQCPYKKAESAWPGPASWRTLVTPVSEQIYNEIQMRSRLSRVNKAAPCPFFLWRELRNVDLNLLQESFREQS